MTMEDIRPSFELTIPARRQRVLEILKREFDVLTDGVHAQMAGHHMQLLVDESERRYWSPTLSLSFEDEGAITRVRGRYGPHASVWTMFMSLHIFWVFCGVAGALYGVGVWTLGHTPWGLLALPVSLALVGFTYGAMRIGQGMGSGQIAILHAAFQRMLDAGERAKD